MFGWDFRTNSFNNKNVADQLILFEVVVSDFIKQKLGRSTDLVNPSYRPSKQSFPSQNYVKSQVKTSFFMHKFCLYM